MIYIGKKELVTRRKGNKIVQSIYKGAKLIWQAIRSCFGSGAWFNDKAWINTEGWAN